MFKLLNTEPIVQDEKFTTAKTLLDELIVVYAFGFSADFPDKDARREHESQIWAVLRECQQTFRTRAFSFFPGLWDTTIKDINELIEARSGRLYKDAKISYTDDDERNGYALYTVSHNIMQEADIERWVETWNKCCEDDDDDLEYWPGFWDHFTDTTCSDWCKQDDHGECFGGFWQAEDGSFDNENAYTLSQRHNAIQLYNLPFPNKLLFETVENGCSNRMESVRYSNMCMCWFVDKAAAMGIELEPYEHVPVTFTAYDAEKF